MITAPHGRQQPFTMVDGANTYSVFAIENGQVKIVNAKISQAQIDSLIVGTSNIAPGAVTSFSTANGGNSSGANGFNMTVNHGLGSPTVKLEAKTLISMASGATQAFVTLTNATDGTILENNAINAVNSITFFTSVLFTPPADRETTVVRMDTNVSTNSSAANRFMFASIFKR